jgi:hypothetical protein
MIAIVVQRRCVLGEDAGREMMYRKFLYIVSQSVVAVVVVVLQRCACASPGFMLQVRGGRGEHRREGHIEEDLLPIHS